MESSRSRLRAWTVVGASFITMGLLYGIWYSYSVYLLAFLAEFGWSRALIAGGFSVFVLVHGAVGPLFGPLAERFGPRRVMLAGGCLLAAGLLVAAETTQWWHLYLAFGGLTAAGIGISGYVPCVVLVRGWFPTRIGTAVGIASAGIGAGIAALVPLSQLMIEQIGWRWAFRVLAALVIAWMIPATLALFADPPVLRRHASQQATPSDKATSSGAPHWTLPHALRSGRFWGLALALFACNAAVQLLLVHQVAYLVDHGVSAMVAATVAGLVGLTSIPGKIGWGYLLDRMRRETIFTFTSVSFVLGVALLVLAGAYPATLLPYAYAVLIGLGYSVIAPLTPATASDMFGGPGFATIFGVLHMGLCVGTAMGAWGGGEIFDRTGSYAAALWLAAGLTVLACGLLWVVSPGRPNPPPDRP